VSFPHGGGIMVPGVRGSIVAGHEDGDDALRRRELRLLKNKSVLRTALESLILNTDTILMTIFQVNLVNQFPVVSQVSIDYY